MISIKLPVSTSNLILNYQLMFSPMPTYVDVTGYEEKYKN